MNLGLRCVFVFLGFLVIADVCSGAYRSGYSGYRSYSSYSSYRSYRTSGAATSSGGGFIAGMVVLGVFGAAVIIVLIVCLLKKNGTICASPKVTATPSSTVDTLNKGFKSADNYNLGFVNPPPPPTYSDVYPPPSYSNRNVFASDPAYPPTAPVSQ
ncbi:uncharacterized protein LOC127834475 [Dreissena polymorpha]|uniref:Uncharacterized protein n=1 Tax=Dreissena polymorpha TaxID=45954 RepID=A0A9D4G7K4_DREPO|nr:uncharacterized protein LOC127834475 [Dreissena polymorpha]XP_052216301.1 uncharacterized protein LOC127834475 [Dreissena polymorpha]KAH3812004.1 hypothetical protein DPMN_140425 [Dreissena polymorpha]